MDESSEEGATLCTSNFTFYWSVEDFIGLDTKIESPTFIDAHYKTKWCLQLKPNGDSRNTTHVGIYLVYKGQNDVKYETKFSFFLIDNQGKKILTKKNNYIFTESNKGYGVIDFVERTELLDKKNLYMQGKSLVIGCTVAIMNGQSSSNESIISETQICEHLSALLDSKRFSDLIINVDGQEIHAHKAILVSRSPVFASMFSHDLKEEIEGRIEITDIEKEICEEMIKFIYTDKAPSLKEPEWRDKWGEGLLAAADKYDLQRLKLMCELELSRCLSLETAPKYLKLAYFHSADYLKKKSISFINGNSAVIRTKGWKDLASKCPNAIVEVYEALLDTPNVIMIS